MALLSSGPFSCLLSCDLGNVCRVSLSEINPS